MRLLFILVFTLMLSVSAYAASRTPSSESAGGYTGPVSGAKAETVAAAINLPDRSRVVLTGHIISRLAGSRDEYMFRDDTGEIQVEIPAKLFRGLDIGPENTVRLSGKVDNENDRDVEIDVKVMELLK